MKSRLRQELQQYLDERNYPLHMPGHKRRCKPEDDLPYDWDLTEVSGTDDLHHPQDILKEAMERTASLCCADRTWYLVNGSTVGNLAGVYALTHQNGEVIMARNCHRSLFHIAQLRNLQVHWIIPKTEETFAISSSIDPDEVKRLLEAYPNSEAVILTSPTYEGVVSDIQSIAKICHAHHVPLFVDEAHGAHFGFYNGFPTSSIQCGADLVVQSFHKTLPSLTQTAVLHMKHGYVDEKKVEQALDIFETSSPSYPLLVSLDACTQYIQENKEACFSEWLNTIHIFEESIQGLKHLKVLCHQGDSPKDYSFYAYDPSKILIHSDAISGNQLQKILLEKYHFELEMSMGNNALAMTGCAEDLSEIQRFGKALKEIDADLNTSSVAVETKNSMFLPSSKMTISEAIESKDTEVSIQKAEGKISHEYIYCYPPGIPLVIPGEEITNQILKQMNHLKKMGYTIHFSDSRDDSNTIHVCAL